LSQQPATGYAEYPPLYWAEEWAKDHPASAQTILNEAIIPALQAEIDKIESPVKLRAGQNVHVLYNAGVTALAREPAFEMYISIEDKDSEQITTDGLWNGEPIYFYPQDAVLKLRTDMMAAAKLDTDERDRKQAEIDALPMVPNDRGIFTQ
jgi:hypothetical protein